MTLEMTLFRSLLCLCMLLLAPLASRADIYLIPPPGVDLIGEEASTVSVYEDTMPDIARRNGLGYEEILSANPGADPWLPGEGLEIALPTRHILPPVPHEGLTINLPEHRLYYFPRPAAGQAPQVISHPISVGQMDWETPLGVTKIVAKQRKPTWFPPESIRAQHAKDGSPIPAAVPPGPDNPLGDYAMRLGIPGGAYLIHGTNKPVGVGMQITHGCIRMYPEDIESLFRMVDVGTPVRIINQPVKTGWMGDVLYLEVHPPLEKSAAKPIELTELTRLLVAATQERAVRINWPLAERVLADARGMPVAVSLPQITAAADPDLQ
jgi:L,D-transpeptidase ErfK/SrfK